MPTNGISPAGGEPFPWDSLVSRVMHPIQVAVIEAMLWVGLPLAPSDLCPMFENEYSPSHVAYHAKALAERGVLVLVDTEPVRGAIRHNYLLAPESEWQ